MMCNTTKVRCFKTREILLINIANAAVFTTELDQINVSGGFCESFDLP